MNDDITRTSRFLSLVLRHKPEEASITLDKNGWVSVDDLLRGCRTAGHNISMTQLEKVVEENDKKRFAFSEDKKKIRASQGHSVGVDLALESSAPPDHLFHGTTWKYVEKILDSGIKKMARTHVHLSAGIETARKVGGRRGTPTILFVDSGAMHKDGIKFYVSDNKVWLVDYVPPKYIKVISELDTDTLEIPNDDEVES